MFSYSIVAHLYQMALSRMQLAPSVNCIFRIRDGDDSNDDVEDDGLGIT